MIDFEKDTSGVSDIRVKLIGKIQKTKKKYEKSKKKLEVQMEKFEALKKKLKNAEVTLENYDDKVPMIPQELQTLDVTSTTGNVSSHTPELLSTNTQDVSPETESGGTESGGTESGGTESGGTESEVSLVTQDLSNFIEIGHIGTSLTDRSLYLLRESCLNNSHYTISLAKIVGNGTSGNVYNGLYYPLGKNSSEQTKIVAKIFIDYGGARGKVPGVIFQTLENNDEYDKYDTDDLEINSQLLAYRTFPEFVPRIFAMGHCDVFVKDSNDPTKLVASSSDKSLGDDSVTVLVMQAGGITFTEWSLSVKKNKMYTVNEAISLVLGEMQKISNAYIELNNRGILHRDSKGQNIVKMIDATRDVSIGYRIGWMIVDFGWSDVKSSGSNSINFSHMDSFFFYFFTARYGKVLPSKFYRNNIAVHYGAILANGMLKYCLKSELFPDESSILYSPSGLQLYIVNLEQDYDKFLPISWRDDLTH
jgi:hypothetical protein